MKWQKKGLIFCANGESDWMHSHAMIPTPILIDSDVLRIYLTFCDKNGIGRIGYIDVDANNPQKILNISDKPILDIGIRGCFDDNGVLVCSVLNIDRELFLYYVGFEICSKIRYRLFTGLAIGSNKDILFKRYSYSPVLDRTNHELYFRGGPYVMCEEKKYKMWYVGGSDWLLIDGKEMPVYRIKYIESPDGKNWPKESILCIDIENDKEYGFGRPYVIKHNGIYKMFYSIRIKHKGYRLGYAESKDGINWIRKDKEVGIDVSETGWDSQMICYSSVITVKDKTYMFYNGNEFGKTGFGYAELLEW